MSDYEDDHRVHRETEEIKMSRFMQRIVLMIAFVSCAISTVLADTKGTISRHYEDEWEEWYWQTTVALSRGQAHTFWITGCTTNSLIDSLDVFAEFTYKEDGETYEDYCWASESYEIENENGTVDRYVILTEDDWEWVPQTKKSLKFTVKVWGWEPDENSTADDRSFRFGHMAGEIWYSRDLNVPVGMRSPAIVGCPVSWKLSAPDGSVLSAAGLPRGLTASADTNGVVTITGTPAETGTNTVVVSLTTVKEGLVSHELSVIVAAPPCIGTYTGFLSLTAAGTAEPFVVPAPLTVSVDDRSVLTGSVTLGGAKVALSATACTSYDVSARRMNYQVTVDPSKTVAGLLPASFDLSIVGDVLTVSERDGLTGAEPTRAYRPAANDAAYADAVAPSVGTWQLARETYVAGEYIGDSVFVLTVDAKGSVTLKGTLADGTTVKALGRLSGDQRDEVSLLMTGEAFDIGGFGLDVSFHEGAWGEVRSLCAAHYDSRRRADTVYTFGDTPQSGYQYDLARFWWVGSHFSPSIAETTRFVFAFGDRRYAYDLKTDAAGKVTGLGASADKAAPKITYDPQTGCYQGSVTDGRGPVSLFGLLSGINDDTVIGGGMALRRDGSFELVTVTYETWMQVDECLDALEWWDAEEIPDGIVAGREYSFSPVLTVDGQDAPLTVTGLPTGLAYDSGTRLISGTPAKPGKYAVKYAYQIGTKKVTRTKTLIVSPLCDRLTGTFEGYVGLRDAETDERYWLCPFKATIDAAGALSGTVTAAGKKLPFAQATCDRYDYWCAEVCYEKVTMDVRDLAGGNASPIVLTLRFGTNCGLADAVNCWDEQGVIVPWTLVAVRDQTKDAGREASVAPFVGTYQSVLTDWNGAALACSVAVDGKGVAKISGMLPSGETFAASARLYTCESEPDQALACVCVNSKSLGEGGGLRLTLRFDGVGMTTEAGVLDCGGASFVDRGFCEERQGCRYSPGCWSAGVVLPEATYLSVDYGRRRGLYELTTDGKGNATGLGKTVNGSPVSLKFDDKTGLFSGGGTVGGEKVTVFGALLPAEDSGEIRGRGSAVWASGSPSTLTVGTEALDVQSNLGDLSWNDPDASIRVGWRQTFEPAVVVNGEALALSVSGLPSGLVYDKKTGRIEGAATKPGTYKVTFAYQIAGKKMTQVVPMTVADLPDDFPAGTYEGVVSADLGAFVHGTFAATVSANGSLTGSFVVGGKKVPFSAVGYDADVSTGGWLEYRDVEVDASAALPDDGRCRLTLLFNADDAMLGSETCANLQSVTARRVQTKDANRVERAAPYVGTYALSFSSMLPDGQRAQAVASLTVDMKGNVKVAGQLIDGSAFSGAADLWVREDGEAACCDFVLSNKTLVDGSLWLHAELAKEPENVKCRARAVVTRYERARSDALMLDDVEVLMESYRPGAWFDPALVPEATYLSFSGDYGEWQYEVMTDANGDVVGIGRTANGAPVTLKLDNKTGLFTGSGTVYGKKLTVFGVLHPTVANNGISCAATVRTAAGDVSELTVDAQTLEVAEDLCADVWNNSYDPLYVGTQMCFSPSVLVDGKRVDLSVTGLPPGLAYDADEGCVCGRAAKAGIYGVKFSYVLGTRKIVRTVTMTIAELPNGLGDAAYEGYAYVGGIGFAFVPCPFAATVSASGALSGSLSLGGRKLPFVAVGPDGASDRSLSYNDVFLDISAVDPGETAELSMSFYPEDATGWGNGGILNVGPVVAWRDRTKAKDAAKAVGPFVGTYLTAFRTTLPDGSEAMTILSLTVDKNGAVKATGTFADGQAVSAAGVLSVTAEGDRANLALPVVGKSFGQGGLAIDVCLSCEEDDVTCFVSAVGVWFDLASGRIFDYTLETLFAARYEPGCWLDEELDPNATCLALGCDGRSALYELTTDTKGVVTGIGKTANGSRLALKFDAKTGMFSGSAAAVRPAGCQPGSPGCKVFGALARAGDESGLAGAGTVVWDDGTLEPLTVDWRQLEVAEDFGEADWNDPEAPLRVGSAVRVWPSVTVDGTEVKLTVTGLPSGMKYEGGAIVGAPTKAGTYAVKFAYSIGSKKVTRSVAMTVVPLPADAVGTYQGVAFVECSDGEDALSVPCPVTVTVDAVGALKGTLKAFGKQLSFAAAGYDVYESDGTLVYGAVDGEGVAIGLQAIDSAVAESWLRIRVGWDMLSAENVSGDWLSVTGMGAWRDQSKDAGRTASVAPYVGTWTALFETIGCCGQKVPVIVSAVVDAKGTVKVSGTFMDGTAISASAPLWTDAENRCACVSLPMTSAFLKDGGWALHLYWTEDDGTCAPTFVASAVATRIELKSGYGRELDQFEPLWAGAYEPGAWFDSSLVPAATGLVLGKEECDDYGNELLETVAVEITNDKDGKANGLGTQTDSGSWQVYDVETNLGDWTETGYFNGSYKLTGVKLKLDDKTGLFTGTIPKSASSDSGKLCCGLRVAQTHPSGKIYGALVPTSPGEGLRGAAIVVWDDDWVETRLIVGSRALEVVESFGGLESCGPDAPLVRGAFRRFDLSVTVGGRERASDLKVSGLPPGLAYEPNPIYGQAPRILGTPTKAGVYKVSVSYAIGSQTATKTLTVVVR